MSKNLSTNYYQYKKEILKKKLLKDIKFFLKKTKKKSNNMVVNDTKIYHKFHQPDPNGCILTGRALKLILCDFFSNFILNM